MSFTRALIALTLCLAESSLGEITCEMKIDGSNEYGFSEFLKSNMVYRSSGNSAESMNVLECSCSNENSDKKEDFSDRIVDDFLSKKIKNWKSAQALVVQNCKYLTIDIKNGRQDLSFYLRGGVLLIRNIYKMAVYVFTAGQQYDIGEAENTFSGIYFHNVTLEDAPPKFEFEDRVEVVFDQLSFTKNMKEFDIQITNKNESKGLNPRFILRNSDFRSRSRNSNDPVPLLLTINNDQKYKNGCLAQMGDVWIKNNYFDLFSRDMFMMSRGNSLEFDGNKIEYFEAKSMIIKNVHDVQFLNNFMGVPQYQALELVSNFQPSSCTVNSQALNELERVVFNNNKLASSGINFLKIDIQGNPKPSDVVKKFDISNNDMLVSCNCNPLKEAGRQTTSIDDLIHQKYENSSKCYSQNNLIGRRESICSGKNPSKPEELIIQNKNLVKSEYVTYIVIAAVIGLILGALLGAGVIYLCFSKNNGSITPRDSPIR